MSFISRNVSQIAALRTAPVLGGGVVGRETANGSPYSPLSPARQLEDQQTLFPTMAGDITTISFERVNTTLASWVQLIFSMILTMTGFIFAYHGCYTGNECPGYYMMLYLRAFFWVATYIIHLFVKSRHNHLKLLGYHKFLRITHRQKKAPLQLVSLSNLLILTIHTIILECYGSNFISDCYVQGISLSLFLSVWCLVECMLLTYIHITYFVKVRVFNTMRSPPDALTGSASVEQRRSVSHGTSPEEFINQQFLMIVKMMDENRHLQDKIREVRAAAHLINSESTHLSLAEQSLIGF